MQCRLCPRKCGVDRKQARGFCGVGDRPVVARAFLHQWEEPCISGSRGSGTVFFSGCNLKCVFCQNYSISQEYFGKEVSTRQLGEIYLSLQHQGAHNINLVNPAHFALQIRESIQKVQGLEIPVVYNTGTYEEVETLKSLEGLVDIYLPDLKYMDSDTAARYSGAADYFQKASKAILEMYRQVGAAAFDEEGMMKKGLIIRHLMLPGMSSESIRVLKWIRENLPDDVLVSLMSQYTPCYRSSRYPEIHRRITRREYDRVVEAFLEMGFDNGYVQERESAVEAYIPDFNLEGIPQDAEDQ